MTRVIAEIGVNHCGDYNRAKYMVSYAQLHGAWGVKFQLFVPELVDARTEIRNRLKDLTLNRQQLMLLRKMADRLGLAFGASAFDAPSVELLRSLSPDFQKTACGQAWPGMKRLPVLQIQSYTRSMKPDKGVVPLLCVPVYPAQIRDYTKPPAWARGYSDHTKDINANVAQFFAPEHLKYVEVHVKPWVHAGWIAPDEAVSIQAYDLGTYVKALRWMPNEYPVQERTRVVLKRPIKGQKVAWLRGV